MAERVWQVVMHHSTHSFTFVACACVCYVGKQFNNYRYAMAIIVCRMQQAIGNNQQLSICRMVEIFMSMHGLTHATVLHRISW